MMYFCIFVVVSAENVFTGMGCSPIIKATTQRTSGKIFWSTKIMFARLQVDVDAVDWTVQLVHLLMAFPLSRVPWLWNTRSSAQSSFCFLGCSFGMVDVIIVALGLQIEDMHSYYCFIIESYIYPCRRRGYCIRVCLFVCLSVCLSVCPRRTLVFFSITAYRIETKFSP